MAQCSDAWWQPIAHNFNPRLMLPPLRGLVVHITDGHGGLLSVWNDFNRIEKRASAHFCIDKEGDMWQFIDTDDRAWAIDGDTQDSHWVSVENVATLGEKLTDGQVIGCAILLRWLHEQYDVPFQRARHANEFGLGYHHMFGIGDHVCPGFPVRTQLERIVREACTCGGVIQGTRALPFTSGPITSSAGRFGPRPTRKALGARLFAPRRGNLSNGGGWFRRVGRPLDRAAEREIVVQI